MYSLRSLGRRSCAGVSKGSDARPEVAGSPQLCQCDLRGRCGTWCCPRGRTYALRSLGRRSCAGVICVAGAVLGALQGSGRFAGLSCVAGAGRSAGVSSVLVSLPHIWRVRFLFLVLYPLLPPPPPPPASRLPPTNCHQPIVISQLLPTNCHQPIATQLPPTHCHQETATNQLPPTNFHPRTATNQLPPTNCYQPSCHPPTTNCPLLCLRSCYHVGLSEHGPYRTKSARHTFWVRFLGPSHKACKGSLLMMFVQLLEFLLRLVPVF